MRFKAALTFENDRGAPKTYRADLVAKGLATALLRLLREARSALPRTQWNSICLTLEKVGEAEANPTGDPKRGLLVAEPEEETNIT